MSFKDLPFEQRINKLGDAAEKAFEQTFDHGWIRFGLNRPPLDVSALPKRLRYTPDYLTSKGFVECQGFGRDQLLKVKRDKLDAMCWWATVHPVDYFIWDSSKKRSMFMPLDQLLTMIDLGLCTLDWFPESKAFFSFAAKDLFGP